MQTQESVTSCLHLFVFLNIMQAMKTDNLTQDRLKTLVNYDADTGIFTWRQSRPKCRVGDKVGCFMQTGYIGVRIDNRLYTAHRLVWLYVTGKFPAEQIDHINGNRADNRFANLREATNAENAQNRCRKDNKSGYTGVRKENQKWLAEIKVNYKPMRIGLFATPEEARAAYLEAKHKFHPFSKHQ
jgi:hypothetical protein